MKNLIAILLITAVLAVTNTGFAGTAYDAGPPVTAKMYADHDADCIVNDFTIENHSYIVERQLTETECFIVYNDFSIAILHADLKDVSLTDKILYFRKESGEVQRPKKYYYNLKFNVVFTHNVSSRYC